MNRDPALLSAGAVALSCSATVAALVFHLRRKDLISADEEREIYEHALLMLEEGQEDDDSGVFAAARQVIEEQLRPAGGA